MRQGPLKKETRVWPSSHSFEQSTSIHKYWFITHTKSVASGNHRRSKALTVCQWPARWAHPSKGPLHDFARVSCTGYRPLAWAVALLNPKNIHSIFAVITVHSYLKDMQGIGKVKLLYKCVCLVHLVHKLLDLAPRRLSPLILPGFGSRYWQPWAHLGPCPARSPDPSHVSNHQWGILYPRSSPRHVPVWKESRKCWSGGGDSQFASVFLKIHWYPCSPTFHRRYYLKGVQESSFKQQQLSLIHIDSMCQPVWSRASSRWWQRKPWPLHPTLARRLSIQGQLLLPLPPHNQLEIYSYQTADLKPQKAI